MSELSAPTAPACPTAGDRALQAEEDFARLFNLSLDLLCIAGLDGFFKRVNPSWTRVLGWSEAELLARPVETFMHPEDRERTLQARAGLARGKPVRGLENRYLCKDGSFRWLSWQSVTEPGAATVFCVARDITERRQLDREHMIRSKLEAGGVLAGGIAHDFNNVLAGLMLSLDMVPLVGPANPAQQQHLRDAINAVWAAKSLTDQLLLLTGGAGSRREVCHLEPVLRAWTELVLGGSGRRYECRVAPDLWPVEADPAQIAQVVRGLLLNAREATPPGGVVTVSARNILLPATSSSNTPTGECVEIHIVDTGAGIPAEVLPKVFDPYFSTKPRGVQKGMGLGLTLCRIVLQEHGGSIVIDSPAEGGTDVVCRLPAWHAAGLPGVFRHVG
jgi:PAS domain S-box-containing protein